MKTEFAVIAALLLTACSRSDVAPVTPPAQEQIVCSGGFRERGDIKYFYDSNHVIVTKHDGSVAYYTPVPGETCIISEIQQ